MIDEVDSTNLRELYDSLKDTNSPSYRAFLRKLNRLAESNPRTYAGLRKQLGMPPVDKEPRVRKQKSRHVKHQFIAYDGEGWDDKYVLLANSLGERIVNPDGLSTLDCLEFLNTRYTIPTKHIWFAFGYDVNHILRDLPDADITELLDNRSVPYHGYNLSYVPGKIFSVNRNTYYDTFGFFQTSFLNVVRRMLGEAAITANLSEGKAARGSFETWDIDKLIKYNDEELALLVAILNKLRDAFNDVEVYLSDWYGPGAVAKYWYKEHRVQPDEELDSGRLLGLNGAYFGGRFEQISLGRISNIYEYDLHSAYPAAMVDMPYFRGWRKYRSYRPEPYSIWHISFDLRPAVIGNEDAMHSFLPLPMRSRDGRICYPLVGRGWYWQSEIANVLDFYKEARVTFHEGYVASTEGRPFGWVGDLYDYRQRLKAAGNDSEYAIKVGLNSLYGKTAQRVGENPYFSLAWAGFITSSVRSKLARVGYENGSANIIGFATDALFSRKPLKLRLSDNLGDWEESRYDSGTFFQSGVYRLQNATSDPIDRYRGSPLRRGIDDIITQLAEHPNDYPKVKIGRFISHMLAIKAPEAYGPYRLQFVSVEHELKFDAPYKRHYTDFLERVDPSGRITSDYSRLLRQEITSLPKVWVDDDDPFLWNDYLYGNKHFSNVESYPAPRKDKVEQKLIEEGHIVSDEYYDDVDLLERVPVLEDTSL